MARMVFATDTWKYGIKLQININGMVFLKIPSGEISKTGAMQGGGAIFATPPLYLFCVYVGVPVDSCVSPSLLNTF